MQAIELKPATLIKRYKRFLADVILPDGSQSTIYVANTGTMTNCGEAGDRIWFSTSNNPKRKYQDTWELSERNDALICVNTARANAFVAEALRQQRIRGLENYTQQAEVKYGDSRIDFLLTRASEQCWLEVKSCTLLEQGQGYFPDAATLRGQKHLQELISIKQSGQRAVLLFAIMHEGITSVRAAQHIDPKYASLLAQAQALGVEVIQYRVPLREYFYFNGSEL